MFVPVITYDPDFFADFMMVFSQIEVTNKPSYVFPVETPTASKAVMTANGIDTLAYRIALGMVMQRQTVSAADTAVIKPAIATQIPSTFKTRTFASSLPAPTAPSVMVTGEFQTDASIDPLYDNLVFQVTVGALDLTNTRAANKPVAPVVG